MWLMDMFLTVCIQVQVALEHTACQMIQLSSCHQGAPPTPTWTTSFTLRTRIQNSPVHSLHLSVLRRAALRTLMSGQDRWMNWICSNTRRSSLMTNSLDHRVSVGIGCPLCRRRIVWINWWPENPRRRKVRAWSCWKVLDLFRVSILDHPRVSSLVSLYRGAGLPDRKDWITRTLLPATVLGPCPQNSPQVLHHCHTNTLDHCLISNLELCITDNYPMVLFQARLSGVAVPYTGTAVQGLPAWTVSLLGVQYPPPRRLLLPEPEQTYTSKKWKNNCRTSSHQHQWKSWRSPCIGRRRLTVLDSAYLTESMRKASTWVRCSPGDLLRDVSCYDRMTDCCRWVIMGEIMAVRDSNDAAPLDKHRNWIRQMWMSISQGWAII